MPDGKIAKTAEQLGEEQRSISVAEFFEKNRHLLGFDNPTKALLTVVKEAVDNSLDACEEAQILPEISVEIEDLDDDIYRVTVEDNGPGIVKEQIPQIFAQLLYGSKFGRGKQQRGQQGIGISAAVLYSQLTTGKATLIHTKPDEDEPTHKMELKIDTMENEPDIVKHEKVDDGIDHTGTKIVMELEGRYVRGNHSVDEYIRQTAIMNPHATIEYTNPYDEEFRSERAIEQMPPLPEEIKPHPEGVEVGILERMAHSTSSRTLSSFLQNDFCRVGSTSAEEICRLAGMDKGDSPGEITHTQAKQLREAIKKVDLIRPPTDCLAPIGEEMLRSGVESEVNPEFLTVVTRDPEVYRGNPFQVEAAIAYGGDLALTKEGEKKKEGAVDTQGELFRYANKMPLLYEQSACATKKAVQKTNWKRYGLDQPGGGIPYGPVSIVVHICSTWVPYTSESKEAIASYPDIVKEIKLAVQECARDLRRYLKKQEKKRKRVKKRKVFKKYSPELAKSLSSLTGKDKEEIQESILEVAEKRYKEEEEEDDD